MALRARTGLAAGLALTLAACGGGAAHRPPPPPPTAPPRARPAGPPPRLTGAHPCPAAQARGFTCATLRVPLARDGRVPGSLDLQVATAGAANAPRTLVYLTGGPGQPGVPFGPRARARLRGALRGYRLVLIDQRGTGGGALKCPALQAAVGTSDLTVPGAKAVADCARRLGPARDYFATADTVADLEDLRRALGAPKLAFDGVSYGTFVAARYAIAHPDRVDRLVLDSVVPAAGLDGLEDDGMRRVAKVLPGAAPDIAAEVRAHRDGPALLDTIVALSVGPPKYTGVQRVLARARAGDRAPLKRFLAAVRRAQQAPPRFFSAGLHAATLCADIRAPWGSASAPTAARVTAVARAAARVDPGPFDRATVAGNGWIRTCELWPAPRRRGAFAGHRGRHAPAGPGAAAGGRSRPLDPDAVAAAAARAHPGRPAAGGARIRALGAVPAGGRARPPRRHPVPTRRVLGMRSCRCVREARLRAHLGRGPVGRLRHARRNAPSHSSRRPRRPKEG